MGDILVLHGRRCQAGTLARSHARTLARSRGSMSKFQGRFQTIAMPFCKALHNMVNGLRPETMLLEKISYISASDKEYSMYRAQ